MPIQHRFGSPAYWTTLLNMPRDEALAELAERDGTSLVGVAEIAERAGVAEATVHSWRRRRPDFPAPLARLAAGPVWDWTDIAAWLPRLRVTRPRDR